MKVEAVSSDLKTATRGGARINIRSSFNGVDRPPPSPSGWLRFRHDNDFAFSLAPAMMRPNMAALVRLTTQQRRRRPKESLGCLHVRRYTLCPRAWWTAASRLVAVHLAAELIAEDVLGTPLDPSSFCMLAFVSIVVSYCFCRRCACLFFGAVYAWQIWHRRRRARL